MNILKLLMFVLITLTTFKTYGAAGFEDGDKFTIQPMRGSVSLRCVNGDGTGQGTRYYNCDTDYISPIGQSKFVNDSGVSAKKVRLTVTRENGSIKTKTKKWSNKKARSRRFNLLIGSVFQRPILRYGTNSIHYEMLSKSGDVVEDGEFSVEVTRSKPIVCAHRYFTAYNNDCSYPDRFCRQVYRDSYNCH